jgi:hypothetical protein
MRIRNTATKTGHFLIDICRHLLESRPGEEVGGGENHDDQREEEGEVDAGQQEVRSRPLHITHLSCISTSYRSTIIVTGKKDCCTEPHVLVVRDWVNQNKTKKVRFIKDFRQNTRCWFVMVHPLLSLVSRVSRYVCTHCTVLNINGPTDS